METILEVPEISFEEAQTIVQQQLVLILHAHGCQQRDYSLQYCQRIGEDIDCDLRYKCNLPFCEDTKKCLDHIRTCFDAESCQRQRCHATREIIRHWKSCMKKSSCQICSPVFNAQHRNTKSKSRA